MSTSPHMSVPAQESPWAAPTVPGPVHARVELPGSKSLTARALVLAAIASAPTTLTGVLRSRDTNLMITALTTLGARVEELGESTSLCIHPAALHVTTPDDGEARIDCGLAGTVMRFVPPLAALVDAPVLVDGDDGARLRPLGPLLDTLASLGAEVIYLGEVGHLPARIGPIDTGLLASTETMPSTMAPADRQDSDGLRQDVRRPVIPHSDSLPPGPPRSVTLDASGSSQFLSALLLTGCLHPGGLAITPTGPVPSLPHVTMTVTSLRERGVVVDEPTPGAPEGQRTWTVHPGRPGGGSVAIEPDLSNAGPFLAAALAAGGSVSVPHWPVTTTQAGDAWRDLLPRLGGAVSTRRERDDSLTLTATGTGRLAGIDTDLSAVGELAPAVAALAVLASAQGHSSRLTGIAHLRGHETDRLAALATEITRLGGAVTEFDDGLTIHALPPGTLLRGAEMEAYADHRMATFAAVVGLGVSGVRVRDVACTDKTLPGFTRLWTDMLASTAPGTSTPPTAIRPAHTPPEATTSPDDALPPPPVAPSASTVTGTATALWPGPVSNASSDAGASS